MAIEEMVLLNMTFKRPSLDKVLLSLKETSYFYPLEASKIVHNVKDVQTFQEDNVYVKLTDRLIQIASDMKLELNNDLAPEHSINMEKSDDYLNHLEEEIKKIKDVTDELIKEKEENELTLKLLEHLSLSQMNIDELLNCHYVHVRFGRLKRSSFDKMKYYEGRPFIFNKLGSDHHYIWGCYLATSNYILEVDNIFQALGFDEVKIPDFVHGTSDAAKVELTEEVKAMQEYIMRMDQKMKILRETHKIDILKLYSTVCFLKGIEDYKVYIEDFKSKCAVYGFIAKRNLEKYKNQFHDMDVEYQILPSDILEDKDIEAPTVVHNAKVVEPFEVLSHVKQSDKIDYTIAFAILYYAVFIIFLGDIGVGAVMALLTLLLRKKSYSRLLLSLSLATFIGGLLYGKLFYSFTLYSSIGLPLSTFYRIVDGVVLLGAGTYTIRSFIKMYNQQSVTEKLLSIKGLCGLIGFYALLAYIGCVYEAHWHVPMIPFVIVIVACISLILMKSAMKQKLK